MGPPMCHFLLTLTLFAAGISPAQTYSKAAPCVSLLTMRPSSVFHGHPLDAKAVPPPFTFRVLDETGAEVHSYEANKVYTVRLSGKTAFKGFLLQPRMSSEAGQIIGHFRIGQFQAEPDWETKGIQFQTCASSNQDSITHTSSKDRYQVVAKWSSDQADNAVQFAATIVVNQTYFWAEWAPSEVFLSPKGAAQASTGPSLLATSEIPDVVGTTKVDIANTPAVATSTSAAVSTAEAATSSAPVQSSQNSTSIAPSTNATEITPAATTDKNVVESANISLTNGTSSAVTFAEVTGQTSIAATTSAAESTPAETTAAETTVATTTVRPTKGHGGRGGKQPKPNRPGESTKKPPKRPSGGGPELPIGSILPDQIGSEFNPFSAAAGSGGRRPPPGPVVILQPQKPNEEGGKLIGSASTNGELCTSNPCRNNGTCYTDPESEFTCVCTKGWAGKECAERDNCIGSPCKNGAVCINDPPTNGFKCECQVGWSGDICDRVCPSYICKNGGTCKIDPSGDYGCNCSPGWTGKNCETEINECDSSPCLHGGSCKDKLNGFTCSCQKGYTGDHCHRPCLNIYKSCERWREEDRCESMRHLTKFFDVNCAITCSTCEPDNSTMHIDYPPYPPTLESFHWLIGRWLSNSTFSSHFPVDFETGAEGYSHVMSILVNEVPMFGTPSLNYTLWAINNRRPDDIQAVEGFLTLKRSPEANKTAALMTTSNNGINMIEEGAVIQEKKYMELRAVYNATLGYMKYKLPQASIRIFSLEGEKLKVKVKKTDWYGKQTEFAMTYTRTLTRKLY